MHNILSLVNDTGKRGIRAATSFASVAMGTIGFPELSHSLYSLAELILSGGYCLQTALENLSKSDNMLMSVV